MHVLFSLCSLKSDGEGEAERKAALCSWRFFLCFLMSSFLYLFLSWSISACGFHSMYFTNWFELVGEGKVKGKAALVYWRLFMFLLLSSFLSFHLSWSINACAFSIYAFYQLLRVRKCGESKEELRLFFLPTLLFPSEVFFPTSLSCFISACIYHGM